MAAMNDLNELGGYIGGLNKADLTTLLGYLQTRLSVLGKTAVATTPSASSKYALSDAQTYINSIKNTQTLQQIEVHVEQLIGKLPV